MGFEEQLRSIKEEAVQRANEVEVVRLRREREAALVKQAEEDCFRQERENVISRLEELNLRSRLGQVQEAAAELLGIPREKLLLPEYRDYNYEEKFWLTIFRSSSEPDLRSIRASGKRHIRISAQLGRVELDRYERYTGGPTHRDLYIAALVGYFSKPTRDYPHIMMMSSSKKMSLGKGSNFEYTKPLEEWTSGQIEELLLSSIAQVTPRILSDFPSNRSKGESGEQRKEEPGSRFQFQKNPEEMHHFMDLRLAPNAFDGLNQEQRERLLRRTYQTLSQFTHPDAGGSSEEFKKVNEAYEFFKMRFGI